MTDANRTRVAVVEEATFGTTPPTPTMYILPITNHSLAGRVDYVQSRLIRSDRNVPDTVRVNESAGGTLGTELQYTSTGAFWQLLKRTMQSDAEGAVYTDATGITTGAGAKTILDAGSAFVGNVEVGDIVRLTGGETTIDNGYYRVNTVAAGTLTVDRPANFSGDTLLTLRRGVRIKNGTTQKSFSAELGMLAIPKYEVLVGLTPDTFSLAIQDGQITTCTFGFVGQKSNTRSGTGFSGASYTAAPVTSVMDCKSNIQAIRVANTAYSAKAVAFEVRNGAAARTVLGTLGPTSIRTGTFVVTGSVEAYFADYTELDKFFAATESELLFVTQDNAGNAYSWSLPTLKWTAADAPVQGLDTDIIQRLTFQAYLDDDEAVSLRVQAFAAP